MITRPARIMLAAAALASLLACSVKAPPSQVWTIVAREPDEARGPRFDANGPALAVMRFTAAADVRTMDMQWRDEGGHLVHQSPDRWSDYPDRMVEELAMDALAASGLFRSVSPAPPAGAATAILSCRLVEFSEWTEDGDMTARAALSWRLLRRDGEVVASDVAEGSSPVGARSIRAVVEAHEAAARNSLTALITQLSPALPKLAPPASAP